MPAKSNSPSPPITIPIIEPLFKPEEVEAGALLLEGEDTCGADAVVARVGAADGTDPAVFVGDELPTT